MKKFYYILFLLLPILAFVGCQDEGVFTPETDGDEPVYVTYRVMLGDESISRAIGDGKKVNELKVGVFQNNQLLKVFTYDKAEDAESFKDVTLPLLKQETYDLVFWAQKKDNGIYSIDENFNITVDYSKYENISLVDTENFEAFTVVKKGVSVANPGEASITLTRPFAQLNIAASEEDIFDEVNKVSFTVNKVYKKFHPLISASSEEVESQGFSFSFSSQDITAKQAITIDGTNYYYLASAYLLAPEKVSLTGGLYKDTELVKELNVTELPLKANSRTNIYGDMIQQEVLQGWDGVTFTEPTQEGVSCNVTADLHIDTPEELAWVLKNGYPVNAKTIHICSNLNMGGKAIENMKSVPEGVTIIGDAPQGTLPYSISNFMVSSTGLFGDATSISVKNIRFDKIEVSNTAAHTGILVGTLKGSSVFENVIIENSSVNSSDINAVVGGMVGFIKRITETSRDEEMSVSFDGCQVKSTTVEGSVVGKFVGQLSGYDNKEILTFTNCSTVGMADMDTSFENTDRSCFSADLVEDDFLGNEKYHRGVVKFGDNRFVPKWDGKRTVEPLLANPIYDGEDAVAGNNKFVVYSCFDLAGVKQKTASPAAIYLKADIDMNGQGEDGYYNVPTNFTKSVKASSDDNNFTPFSYVTTLDGKKNDTENYSIYNLKIEQIGYERAAFILYASGITQHKNINFRNCQTVAVHKEVETDAKAYGAILVSNVDATYTMENVHAYDCKVFALQKVGTLGARINGTSTLKNNSVNNCYVENYECNISEKFESGWRDIDVKLKVYTVNCYSTFYPHGEVGGMFGFIQGNSTISNCHVKNTEIYAYGQDDKEADFDVKDMDGIKETILVSTAKALTGLYLIPGRHVSKFIGDIRNAGTTTISNCTVDSASKCTNRWDKHNDTYHFIGQCYYVKYLDSEGSVTIDGTKLTLADCNRNTKR